MFDSLSEKLQAVFKNLRGYGKLTEKNVADALREVRLALLEADVNYKVAKDFIEKTKQRALGQEVLNSVTPGQQIIKIVHDELVALMGEDERQSADKSAHSKTNCLLGSASTLKRRCINDATASRTASFVMVTTTSGNHRS